MSFAILDHIKEKVLLLDGGIGTELIKLGFTVGACPESWNLVKPEQVRGIHKNYFKAGADAVSTNSFGGNKIKLQSYELGDRCAEINRLAAELAVAERPLGRFVVGSMGPTGKFLQPQGEYTLAQFEEAYEEQAFGLVEGGVDAVLIETQYDLQEALCAVRSVTKTTDLPVFATMTFNKTPRGYFTIMGNTFQQFSDQAAAAGCSAVGANCTIDSKDMLELVAEMKAATDLPVIAQANAGQPQVSTDGKVVYSQPLDDYVRFLPSMLKEGLNIVGGCCGTDPDFIRKMAEFITD